MTRYAKIFRAARYYDLPVGFQLCNILDRMNEISRLVRINELRQRFNPERDPEFPEDEKFFAVAFQEIKKDFKENYVAFTEEAVGFPDRSGYKDLFQIVKDIVDQDIDNELLGVNDGEESEEDEEEAEISADDED